MKHECSLALDARFSLPGTKASYSPDRTFDTEHIRLELELDMARETMNATCRTTLRAITAQAQTMVFDAMHFQIKDVRWNGAKINFTYKDGKLTIQLPKPAPAGSKHTAQISYRIVKPTLGVYFIKPDRLYPDRPTQMWTQGEDEYSRYWFPCHDAPHERTSSEIIATVPAGFVAVSNGALLKTTHDRRKKTSTYHWLQKIPHAAYLMTLTAGRFSTLRETWHGVPVTYYCEKGREADTRRAFGKTPKMLEFFSTFIGVKYPYPKYAQIAAHDFIFGGMENTSATTQTEYALLDERAAIDYTSDELVAHELAHQWFGDYLTCKDWSHAWLNESFATYFDVLFKRSDKGADEFFYALRANANEYFSEDRGRYRRSISTSLYKRPSDLFDKHLYEKGSLVLHMIHHDLGEDQFRRAIKTYVTKNKGRVVESIDLINAIEEATGKNLRRFFDQWVFGAGHPEFKIRAWWDARSKEMNVRLVQTHAQTDGVGLFNVASEFLFLTKKGEQREKVQIDAKTHLFKFKLAGEPSMALFDPDHAVLMKTDFPKSEEWLLTQLGRAKNVLSRIDAAHELARLGTPLALEALRAALLKDSFWGVSVEAARALGSLGREEAATILLHSLGAISHPKIRRAIYEALRGYKSTFMSVEIEKRFKQEASYFVECERLRTLAALRHPKAAVLIREALKKDSWNDVLRSAALEAMAMTRERAWLPTLLTYTKAGHHQRLRLAAIRSILSFAPATEPVRRRLLDLLNDPFLLVQNAAVRALESLGDERAVPALKKLGTGDRDGRLKRLAEEAVNRITKGF